MVAPDSKLLKPRNINRLVLLLGFLAPLVYLFGTQFFALAGAHGEEVLASGSYQDEWIQTDSFSSDHDYKFVFYEDTSSFQPLTTDFTFYVAPSLSGRGAFVELWINKVGGTELYINYYNILYPNVAGSGVYRDLLGWLNYPDWATIYFSSSSLPSSSLLDYGTLYYKNPVQNTNYSDTLFGSMFNGDNFLAELGRESLKDNPKGFAPYGSLIKFLDDTVFHMSDNSLALMGYGYVYYCGHVVLLDLIALILIFIPRLIAMVLEFVTKGVDMR